MSTIVRAIVCLLAVMVGLPSLALPALREHSKWLDLPLERLIDMADKDFADGGSNPVSRWNVTLAPGARKRCCPWARQYARPLCSAVAGRHMPIASSSFVLAIQRVA